MGHIQNMIGWTIDFNRKVGYKQIHQRYALRVGGDGSRDIVFISSLPNAIREAISYPPSFEEFNEVPFVEEFEGETHVCW